MTNSKPLVRIHPSAIGGRGQHYGRAILIEVDGDEALVKPLGRHRKLERVQLRHIKGWTAKDAGGIAESKFAEAIKQKAEKTKIEPIEDIESLKETIMEMPQENVTPLQIAAIKPEPLSLADELALFRKSKESLFDRMKFRIEELAETKECLKTELSAVETELTELTRELRAAGQYVPLATYVPVSAQGERLNMNAQGQLLYEYLRKNPGVWFEASTLKGRLPEVTYQVSLLLKDYISDGRIRVSGEKRGTAYSA